MMIEEDQDGVGGGLILVMMEGRSRRWEDGEGDVRCLEGALDNG